MTRPFFTLLCCLICFGALAQTTTRRFGAALEAGLTASQLDGDLAAGYSKLGLMAGVRSMIYLQPKTHLSVGFLFAQRGAQDELRQTDPDIYSITLNYLEVPIMYHYSDWLVQDGDDSYYKANIGAGVSYGRLIGAKLKDTGSFAQLVVNPTNPPAGKDNYLNDQDLSLTIGGNIFFKRNLGFGFRWMRSVTFVYNPRKWDSPPLPSGWNAHSLTFSLVYRVL
jgi:Outer membrane protein beta-barrel domain